MMRLKITTPSTDNDHFMTGWAANLTLNDVDVSRYVKRVILTVDADKPISAEVTLYLTAVDVDVPAVIKPLFEEAKRSTAESVSEIKELIAS